MHRRGGGGGGEVGCGSWPASAPPKFWNPQALPQPCHRHPPTIHPNFRPSLASQPERAKLTVPPAGRQTGRRRTETPHALNTCARAHKHTRTNKHARTHARTQRTHTAHACTRPAHCHAAHDQRAATLCQPVPCRPGRSPVPATCRSRRRVAVTFLTGGGSRGRAPRCRAARGCGDVPRGRALSPRSPRHRCRRGPLSQGTRSRPPLLPPNRDAVTPSS